VALKEFLNVHKGIQVVWLFLKTLNLFDDLCHHFELGEIYITILQQIWIALFLGTDQQA
jgi:hypothetical protein